MEAILDASERLTRAEITEIPDGEYYFEDWCDDDALTDEPIKIAAMVRVGGDGIEVDFSGSSKQVRGGMNAPLAVTVSATCYAIKCLTDPGNPANTGSYRPIKINAPLGSVVNPMSPASVIAGNHETACRIADVIIGALSQALPTRVCAAGSGSSGVLALGVRLQEDSREREVIMVEAHGSGQGGNVSADGVNARRVNIGNTGNTPNEVLETSFPIRVLRYAISEDGGGAGKNRGGTGLTRVLRLEHDATMTITADRSKFAPYGVFGGLPAPRAEFWAQMPDGTRRPFKSKTPPLHLFASTVIHFRPAGGAGYGPPKERPLEKVQADLDDGYITPKAAQEFYEVEIREDIQRAEGRWVAIPREKQPR